MKKLHSLFNAGMQSKAVRTVATGSALVVASVPSFADDLTTQISEVSATANTNQSAVIGAVITLAALSFGVGYILRWLSK